MELQEIDEFRELQRESFREKIYDLRKKIFNLQCNFFFKTNLNFFFSTYGAMFFGERSRFSLLLLFTQFFVTIY